MVRLQKPFISLLLAFSLLSCGLFNGKEPCEGSIPFQQMTQIVKEVFLLESWITTHPSSASHRDSIPYYYASIMQKHNTTLPIFRETFACYLLDRDQMNRLLDAILNDLSIEESRITEKVEKELDLEEIE